MTLLDPGDREFADEQEYAANVDPQEDAEAEAVAEVQAGEEPIEGTIGLDDDPPPPEGCAHPPHLRRLENGEQLCSGCWSIVEGPPQAIVPVDRPGSTDPTMRSTDGARRVGLRHVQYDPEKQYASRPYTPDEVELEIVRILAQIERGAGFLTTKEEERGAAKLAYDLAYARALIRATGKSAEGRAAQAMLACEELYEQWQLLELTCKTAREGMHNLRSMLSGFQSVARSVSSALGSYR